ncbi:hypothetical protein DWZ56_18795 [Lachnotalea sp. AF33-28]|nr:hypothetical protein DWZ56_18795 [Lachnotalea sp. AF33-28]
MWGVQIAEMNFKTRSTMSRPSVEKKTADRGRRICGYGACTAKEKGRSILRGAFVQKDILICQTKKEHTSGRIYPLTRFHKK